MSTINPYLVGKWYALYIKNGSTKVYAVYKGNTRTKAGELPKDAVTVWFYPEGYELFDGSIKVPNKIHLRDKTFLTSCSIEGITFPPKEYLEDNNVEELADIVEVIYAILDSKNVSIDEFETIRKLKVEKRGAFKKKIFLEKSIE